MSRENKIQALMDEVYNEWKKEGNNGRDKWDVLKHFSDAHQIAVTFGNFNYQVGNGGISQWIYNGYFHDDSEKFIEYLEVGAKIDERCGVILDKIYKLDQYAQETDCNRDGHYIDHDDEDMESQFIGDMIDCDAFDKWYYEHCDKDDWWKTVISVMHKVKWQAVLPINPALEADSSSNRPTRPFSAYIENATDQNIGGFRIPLPTSFSEIRPFLDGAEIIDRRDMKMYDLEAPDDTDLWSLTNKINDIMEDSELAQHTLNEINYLAARIDGLDSYGLDIFLANITHGRNCDSVADMINLTFSENLNLFDLQPAYAPEQYGDYLVNNVYQDVHMDAYSRLVNSEEDINLGLVEYIEKLEKHVDLKKFGKAVAEEENGVFTEQGYLTGGDDGLLEIYKSPDDIPFEYIVMREYPDELCFLTKHIPPDAGRAELEYLAEKIKNMVPEKKKVFGAVAEAGFHCGSITEIINTAENLDSFTLKPFIDELDYGKHRLELDYNDAWESLNSLGVSAEPSDLAMSKLFRTLYHTADAEAYGRHTAKEDGSVFTKQGLLTEEKSLREIYRGTHDLPQAQPAPSVSETTVQSATADERTNDRSTGNPSVLAQIAGYRESQRDEIKLPRERDASEESKKKSNPEL
jgi:hypothetical protein